MTVAKLPKITERNLYRNQSKTIYLTLPSAFDEILCNEDTCIVTHDDKSITIRPTSSVEV